MFYVLERTKKILDELNKYRRSDSIQIESFKMKEGNFSGIAEVDKDNSPWIEFRTGSKWGGRDYHAWFRTNISIPQHFDGRKVALNIYSAEQGWDALNPQMILYINGELVQGLDVNHREVILAHKAVNGTEYQIDIHAYSGMLPALCGLGGYYSVFNENVDKLYYHMKVILEIAEKLDDDNIKTVRDIKSILTETVNLIDLRKPMSDAFYKSIDEAVCFIEEEFYNKLSGSSEVIATCIGHTHIDVAWLWTLSQTREKAARSFSTVLNLMKEYPDYKFMSSQPQLYKFVKEDYPRVYEKIKERIRERRWEPEGAMWVEADCNLSSGESLVRQILFGTRFFEKEFGVKNKILWLPDVFGYSAALPQILKKSGIKYFMTIKISWNQFNKIPYDTFMWQGLDGSEVLTHFVTTCNYEKNPRSHETTYIGNINPSHILGAWQRYQQKYLNNDVLVTFGFGDGGGGPTIEMLENAKRLSKGIPGCPKVEMGLPSAYFEKLEKTVSGNKYLPKWVGELYLEYHRGTYTSMGRNKRYNRKSELLYQDMEFLCSMDMMLGNPYPQDAINEGWEKILLNQFHDIIPGSSIFEVYEESREQYEALIKKGNELSGKALANICSNINTDAPSLVVMNTLSFNRDDIVCCDIPDTVKDPVITDLDGSEVPYQIIHSNDGEKAVFYAKSVPSKGYKTYRLSEGAGKSLAAANTIHVTENHLENDFYAIDIDSHGTISSLYDKKNNRHVLKPGERANKLLAYEDKPMNYDNWDIDIFYKEKMWEADNVTGIEVVEQGPVRGALKISKKFMDSVIVQTIYIYADSPRIDFDTYADWKEDQVLLRAAFPVDVHNDKATFDIQFGNVQRPTHLNTSWDYAKFEVCAHKWVDLSEDGYGVSLLNDCKYGHDIHDGIIGITLIKSGIDPNPRADREEHRFVYSLYSHAGDWKAGKTQQIAYSLNVPLYCRYEDKHEGKLPNAVSFIELNAENVMLETVKKAEDGNEIILRCHEYFNRRTDVTVKLFNKVQKVVSCSLMEEDEEEIPALDNEFSFTINPYEIKTFKLIF